MALYFCNAAMDLQRPSDALKVLHYTRVVFTSINRITMRAVAMDMLRLVDSKKKLVCSCMASFDAQISFPR